MSSKIKDRCIEEMNESKKLTNNLSLDSIKYVCVAHFKRKIMRK